MSDIAMDCARHHAIHDTCNRECKHYARCMTYKNFLKSVTDPEPRPDQLARRVKDKTLNEFM